MGLGWWSHSPGGIGCCPFLGGGSDVVDFLFIVTPIVGVCNCSMFCCTLLYVLSSIAIILMGKRELVALLNLSSWCLVMVERLFHAVPWGCLRFLIVFPDHTHLLFMIFSTITLSRMIYLYNITRIYSRRNIEQQFSFSFFRLFRPINVPFLWLWQLEEPIFAGTRFSTITYDQEWYQNLAHWLENTKTHDFCLCHMQTRYHSL